MALTGLDDVDRRAAEAFACEHVAARPADVAVVIPAYDEAGSIGAVVRGVPARICGLRTETIVIVDGATDGTAAAAREAGALVCDVPVNRGQGAALRLGYLLARGRGAVFIATIDADGQYDGADLDAVIAPLVDGRADFVTGSRRLGRSLTTDRVRGAGVVVFGRLITALTGTRITDPANGLRAMRAEVTASVQLTQPQYQASELLVGAILRGWRVVEVPTLMRDRTAGVTKKGRNLAYGARFARVVLATWWRDRRLRPPVGSPPASTTPRPVPSGPDASGPDALGAFSSGAPKITNS